MTEQSLVPRLSHVQLACSRFAFEIVNCSAILRRTKALDQSALSVAAAFRKAAVRIAKPGYYGPQEGFRRRRSAVSPRWPTAGRSRDSEPRAMSSDSPACGLTPPLAPGPSVLSWWKRPRVAGWVDSHRRTWRSKCKRYLVEHVHLVVGRGHRATTPDYWLVYSWNCETHFWEIIGGKHPNGHAAFQAAEAHARRNRT